MRPVLATPLCALALLTGCTTLTSGPTWVGGTLAESAPTRFEQDEAAIKKRVTEILSEPKTIRAKHILIMHDDSERKPPTIKRTRVDAKARAEEAMRPPPHPNPNSTPMASATATSRPSGVAPWSNLSRMPPSISRLERSATSWRRRLVFTSSNAPNSGLALAGGSRSGLT